MYRALISIFFVVAIVGNSGCATPPVGYATVSDNSRYYVFGVNPSEPRIRFSTTDQKVTLTVRFHYNFVGAYLKFRVKWIAPDGSIYLEEPKTMEWGSNETMIASLQIANHPPAKIPGNWVVEIWRKDELVVSRSFEIDES